MGYITITSMRAKLAASVLVLLFAAVGSYFFNSKTAFATTLPVIYKSGTLASNETWTSGNVYVVSSSSPLTVPSGVTLTIDPGTIVKHRDAMQVNSGGSLVVNGTTADPVIFTSYKDDAYGGDSNGNGASTGAFNDFSTALTVSGGDVEINHALMQDSYYSMRITCYSDTDVVVNDSTVKGMTSVSGCGQGQLSMERNTFDVESAHVDNLNRAITVVGSSDPSGIVLVGANKNTFVGTAIGANIINLTNASIGAGSTWATDSGGEVILTIDSNGLSLVGTLTLASDTVIKIKNGGIQNNNGGVLNITGTSGHPVTVTSYKDDSVGGDTNGDGTATTGSIYDLDTLLYLNGGVLLI